MIATRKYAGFNRLNNSIIAGKLIKALSGNITETIRNEAESGNHDSVLTSSVILPIRNLDISVKTYGDLYLKYFSSIDKEGLSQMINSFVYRMKGIDPNLDFTLLTSYFYAFFIEYWCQMVELVHDVEDKQLLFIGSNSNTEFKVLESAFSIKFSKQYSVESRQSIAAYTLDKLTKILHRVVRDKDIKVSKFANNFNESIDSPKQNLSEKVVVIGILEERRFGRIAILEQKLTELGYKVVLFSCLAKTETLARLNNFPNLLKGLITDTTLLTRNDADGILNSTEIRVKKMFNDFRDSEILDDFNYRGVSLFKHTWNELYEIFMHRFLQASVNERVISNYFENNDVRCFIGMDNSVATSVWIKECNKRKIPNVFHFYNGTQSPIVFQLLIDSFKPTKWFLGGKSHLQSFSTCKSFEEEKFEVIGDIFNDTIVNCDKTAIRNAIRNTAGIPQYETVIVIISSYVVSDFSIEKKQSLFQTVHEAATQLKYKIIVKAHPNEDVSLLREQMLEWGVEGFVFQFENIRDVFIASDLVCMYFSEAAQQAMMVEVPVVSLVPSEMVDSFDKHWNYYSSSAVEFISLGESPKDQIKKICEDDQYRQNLIGRANVFCENNFGLCDGSNGERFAESVDMLAKGCL